MAVVIEEITGASEHGSRGVATHCGNRIALDIALPLDRAVSLLHQPLSAEFDFALVRAWRALPEDQPSFHGLFSTDDGDVRVVGCVHNHVETGGKTLVDVYIQAGPEFLVFDSDDLGACVPAVGEGIECVVVGLCCFPTLL
jgi:hypothetical protein